MTSMTSRYQIPDKHTITDKHMIFGDEVYSEIYLQKGMTGSCCNTF